MKTVIKLAKENGLISVAWHKSTQQYGFKSPTNEELERFYKAIRAEALEEAAKVCDGYDMDHIIGQQLAIEIRGLK